MSRIGKQPIPIPANVNVSVDGSTVRVKGPKGEMVQTFRPEMKIALNEGVLTVERPTESKQDRALHGLTRALLANMVEGVTTGYRKALELVGVGYKAEKRGKNLILTVGYSHPVEFPEAPGLNITTPAPTQIVVEGIDKQLVGQAAAEIRSVRPPEPYKGKGIRYQGEHVRRKAGKAGAK
jgi:large subunit ribosomal protein L6